MKMTIGEVREAIAKETMGRIDKIISQKSSYPGTYYILILAKPRKGAFKVIDNKIIILGSMPTPEMVEEALSRQTGIADIENTLNLYPEARKIGTVLIRVNNTFGAVDILWALPLDNGFAPHEGHFVVEVARDATGAPLIQ
ncbi:MAG: hypothetical protein ABIJ57_02710 [Pseudomonadota bacterium]